MKGDIKLKKKQKEFDIFSHLGVVLYVKMQNESLLISIQSIVHVEKKDATTKTFL